MTYSFDPHRTLDRLESLHRRTRDAIAEHKRGLVQAAEAAAIRLFGQEAELFDKDKQLRDALRAIEQALAEEIGTDFFFVVEWGTDYLIYELETGQTYRREFKLKSTDDGFDVTLKSAVEVEQVWQSKDKPKKKQESANGGGGQRWIEESATEPVTATLLEAGRATIKLIAPGQGSTGFYSEQVLKRDGPQAFPVGTLMYLDHPTVSDEFERPERSVKDIAAKLTSAPRFESQGPKGAGLYAEAEVSEEHKIHLKQFADVTGVSIRAMGEMDGDGNVTKLLPNAMNSVDFVTVPGAGGRIVELIESARAAAKPNLPEVPTMDVNEATIKRLIDEARAGEAEALRESRAETARLRETVIRGEARQEAGRILESVADMHAKAKALVIRNVSQHPPVKDGGLDYDKFAEAVDAETKIVAAMVAEAAGTKPITGAGAGELGEGDDAKLRESLAAEYVKGGMSETAAKRAAGVVQ